MSEKVVRLTQAELMVDSLTDAIVQMLEARRG